MSWCGVSCQRWATSGTETLTRDGRPLTGHLDEEPFRGRVAEQRIGGLTPEAPVLMVHTVADDVVPFEQDRELAERWYARGATVQFVATPVPTHVGGAVPGSAAAVGVPRGPVRRPGGGVDL